MPFPKDHEERIEEVGEFQLRFVSYRLGEQWICVTDNVDPGARLARTTGSTRAEAENAARQESISELERTRVFDD